MWTACIAATMSFFGAWKVPCYCLAAQTLLSLLLNDASNIATLISSRARDVNSTPLLSLQSNLF